MTPGPCCTTDASGEAASGFGDVQPAKACATAVTDQNPTKPDNLDGGEKPGFKLFEVTDEGGWMVKVCE